MYIAYRNPALQMPETPESATFNKRHKLRLKAYLNVCQKYEDEIRIIRQYEPNWKPRF